MAALALEQENNVWLKVYHALNNQSRVSDAGVGATGAAKQASQEAFRGLKLYLSTQKLQPALQYVPFAEGDVDAATGFSLPTGACTVYGIWAIKTGTGTTISYLDLHDKNSITGSTDVRSSLYFKTQGDEKLAIFPTGLAIASASGANLGSVTAIGGSTPTTGDSDSVHGFLILGA